MQWACDHCEKKKKQDLHPYTIKLLQNLSLKQAGYRFNNNDFTIDEWMDIGRVEKCLATPAPSK